MLRKVVLAALAGALLLAAVLVVRTLRFTREPAVVPAAPDAIVRPGAAERLADAIRIPTVTGTPAGAIDRSRFASMHDLLSRHFPQVHRTLDREVVGDASLLYTWRGDAPSLDGLLLMGHLDVVPVEPGTEAEWTHPPFAGVIADGFVWGRGALDDKVSVLGVLEAIESLAEHGYRPSRTVYLAFGHDEESGGGAGAARIASLLRSRGVKLSAVLDEGGVIADGVLPGVTVPIALVGIAEKGAVTVRLTARGTGGHASMPPDRTAIGLLSAAIGRLEDQQMPARLDGATRAMFADVGPLLPFLPRLAFANLWVTEPLVLGQLAASPSTNAAIRTTTAVTMVHGGVRPNVLPASAQATVNMRLLPGDTIDGVVAHVRRVVGDTIAVSIVDQPWEPSPVSDVDAEGYRALARAVRQTVPDAVVAPYLVPGATDARYFEDIAANVYRFLPVRLTSSDLSRLHGVNERVGVKDYDRVIAVIQRFIQAAAQADATTN